MAFEKCITIQELVLRAILKTYYELVKEGVMKPKISHMKQDQMFNDMIEGSKELTHCLVNVVENVIEEEREEKKRSI